MSLNIQEILPFFGTLAGAVLVLGTAHWLLLAGDRAAGSEKHLPRQLLMLVLTIIALVLVILALPVSDVMRGQVLSLLGVLLTGVVALSSTTFVSNAMAGLMLRLTNSFRPGDFVRVGEQFGRVTERGLLHTEIQTEDRDLSTLPNLHLVTNPVTVVHSSGTIVSAELSLGYELHHEHIERLLKEAAAKAGLQDGFVRVSSLNDFSVSYRVSGFLADVRQLLTAKSNLRKCILSVLHADGIEIVSPAFMNQRQLPPQQKVIPPQMMASNPNTMETAPENIIFDKADEAASIEQLREERENLEKELKQLSAQASDDEVETESQAGRRSFIKYRRQKIDELLKQKESEGARK